MKNRAEKINNIIDRLHNRQRREQLDLSDGSFTLLQATLARHKGHLYFMRPRKC